MVFDDSLRSFRITIQDVRRKLDLPLEVHSWTSVRDVKNMLEKLLGTPASIQHICFKGREMRSNHTLLDWGIENDDERLSLLFGTIKNSERGLGFTRAVGFADPQVERLVAAVQEGIENRVLPIRTDEFEGTGGVYLMNSAVRRKVAVFKPQDEEQHMPLNPKHHAGDGEIPFRQSFKPGENCLREVAVYIMDVDGFAGVPVTTLAWCEHEIFNYPGNPYPHTYPKLGSLQRFVDADDVFENLGPSNFSILEIQKIALLDLRAMNCDRNSSNILVQKTGCVDEDSDECHMQFHLTPIDHGFCLPTKLRMCSLDWAWFDMPQIRAPVCPEIRDYLLNLDIEAVIGQLKATVQLPDECFVLIRVMHWLLSEGLKMNFTLRDLAEMVVRESDDGPPSDLERALDFATENAYRRLEVWKRLGKTQDAKHKTSSIGMRSMQSSAMLSSQAQVSARTSIQINTHIPIPAYAPSKSENTTEKKQQDSRSVQRIQNDKDQLCTNADAYKHVRFRANESPISPPSQGKHFLQENSFAFEQSWGEEVENFEEEPQSQQRFSEIVLHPSNAHPFEQTIPINTTFQTSPRAHTLINHQFGDLQGQPLRVLRSLDTPNHLQGNVLDVESTREDPISASPPGFWNHKFPQMHEIVARTASMLTVQEETSDSSDGELVESEAADDQLGQILNMASGVDNSTAHQLEEFDFLEEELNSFLRSLEQRSDSQGLAHLQMKSQQRQPQQPLGSDVQHARGNNLQRVASFSGFESPIVYESDVAGARRFSRLRLEQWRHLTNTYEFEQCREYFAILAVRMLLSRRARQADSKIRRNKI